MDKYEKIEKPREEAEIKDNEIRITTKGKMRNSISYATTLFKEKGFTEVILKAMGRAINKTVTIAEIIKRRIPNLHQITEISSTDITDVYEPLEEGLDTIETTRHVSSITIILSTVPLDTSAPGYQAPLPEDQVKEHVPSAVTSPTAGTVEPPRGMHELALVGVVLRVVLAEARGAEEEGGEGAGELAPEGSVVGEGEAPVQQATGQVSQQQPGGRPFGERRGRGGRGRRGGGGGNFNQGGNGYPVQVVGYPPQPQQGFIGGYPPQPQPGFIGGYPGIPLVAPPAQGMNGGGRGGGGYGGRGGGRRGGRGGFFTGGDHQTQPQQFGAEGAPSGGRGGRGGGRRGGRGGFHGGEQQQHGGGGSPAVQPQQPQ